MTDNKISELPALTGANVADADLFVIVDDSAAQTNSITTSQLRTGLYPGITDAATSETLSLANSYVNFGQAGDPFTIRRAVTDQNIYLSGGTSTSNGANLLLYGSDHSFGPEARLRRGSLDGYILDGAAGHHIFYNDSDAEFIRFAAVNERIGLGTSSPDGDLEIYQSASDPDIRLARGTAVSRFATTSDGGLRIQADFSNTTASSFIQLSVDADEKARIGAGGSVGIGTSSPSSLLHVQTQPSGGGVTPSSNADELVLENNSNCGLTIASENLGSIYFGKAADNDIGRISYSMSDNSMRFYTNVSERMRIVSGNVGIGDTSPDRRLHVNGGADNVVAKFESTDTACSVEFTDPTGTVTLETRNDFRFKIASDIDMMLDSSGNLLVGKTSTSTGTDGAALFQSGLGTFTVGGSAALDVNRNNNAGDVINIRRANSIIGNIGDPGNYFAIIGGNATGTHSGIRFINDASQRPCTNTGTNLDNTVSWGVSGARWSVIYAGTSSINTSDVNEKQQIASLTDAEITAAKAISKLFKTYKWNSSVESKGDAARTHAGVIAQEVEQAMTDAGLDASKYGFWCSDTWLVDANGEEVEEGTEEAEGATSRTRKGIRYAELLAFIGAATEQRLASIEARLDALEAI